MGFLVQLLGRWKRRALARRQDGPAKLGFSPGPGWKRRALARRQSTERRSGFSPGTTADETGAEAPSKGKRYFAGLKPGASTDSPNFPARRKGCSTRNPQPKPDPQEMSGTCQIPTINPSPMTAHLRRSTSVAKRLSKPPISCNLLEPQTPAPFPRIDLPLRQTHNQLPLPQCQAPSHCVGISARTACSAAVRRCTSATIATSICGCAASRCAWPAPSPSASPIV